MPSFTGIHGPTPRYLPRTSLDITCDGTLMWQISLKHETAMNEEGIHSPVFFTSASGYRLSAKAYLNGDGIGLGTHLSLFICVWRGPFDSSLQWPFDGTIVITLVNQSGGKDVVGRITPSTADPAFNRPRNSVNIGIGFPTFIELSQLDNGYIANDTVQIQVTVSNSIHAESTLQPVKLRRASINSVNTETSQLDLGDGPEKIQPPALAICRQQDLYPTVSSEKLKRKNNRHLKTTGRRYSVDVASLGMDTTYINL